MKIADIEFAEPFMSLFPERRNVEEKIEKSMREDGCADPAFPLIVWGTKLIDGYHRLRAARNAGIFDVPVINKDFHSEDEAVLYCVRANADRRHLTDAELFDVVEEVDRINRKKREGNQGKRTDLNPTSSTNVEEVPTHIQTAKDVGVSPRKVEEVRAIRKHGTEEDMQDVRESKATIHQKAEEVKQRSQSRRKPPEMPAAKQREASMGSISPEFKESFKAFRHELTEARRSKWTTTTQEHAIACMEQIEGLIKGGVQHV